MNNNNIENTHIIKDEESLKSNHAKSRVLARLLSKKLSAEETRQVSGGAKADTRLKDGTLDYTV